MRFKFVTAAFVKYTHIKKVFLTFVQELSNVLIVQLLRKNDLSLLHYKKKRTKKQKIMESSFYSYFEKALLSPKTDYLTQDYTFVYLHPKPLRGSLTYRNATTKEASSNSSRIIMFTFEIKTPGKVCTVNEEHQISFQTFFRMGNFIDSTHMKL